MFANSEYRHLLYILALQLKKHIILFIVNISKSYIYITYEYHLPFLLPIYYFELGVTTPKLSFHHSHWTSAYDFFFTFIEFVFWKYLYKNICNIKYFTYCIQSKTCVLHAISETRYYYILFLKSIFQK